MNSFTRTGTIAFVLLVTVAAGCRKDRVETPPAAPQEEPATQATAAIEPAATPPAPTPPSPAPTGLLAQLDELAPYLPSQLTIVGVFPASRLLEALDEIPATVPRLVYAANREDFLGRLKTIYGVDPTGITGTCAFAMVVEAGPLLLCPGGTLSDVKEAYRWNSGKAQGHNVTRNDVEVSVAMIDGHLAAGSVEAVQRAVKVSQDAWPRLSDAKSRWLPALRELAGVDPFSHSGLFFLDPSKAPWCDADCAGTAVFDDKTSVVAVVKARTGRGTAFRKHAESWWTSIGDDLVAIQATAPYQRPLRMPDAFLKPVDLLTRSGDFQLREDQLVFKGNGDAVGLLLSLNAEPPRRWLGEMPVPAGNPPAAQ